MKNKTQFLFVDDGYPEAEEYETNYIPWNATVPGSREKAVAEARSILNSRKAARPLFGSGILNNSFRRCKELQH